MHLQESSVYIYIFLRAYVMRLDSISDVELLVWWIDDWMDF